MNISDKDKNEIAHITNKMLYAHIQVTVFLFPMNFCTSNSTIINVPNGDKGSSCPIT